MIRSKETEREKDWLDIQYLEEAFDARNAAAVASGRLSPAVGLSTLRSRRGLETHLLASLLADTSVTGDAMGLATHPVTVALLLPATDRSAVAHVEIEPIIRDRLRTVPVGAPLHWALVEAVRRRYKMQAMDADRADKLAIRESLNRTDQ